MKLRNARKEIEELSKDEGAFIFKAKLYSSRRKKKGFRGKANKQNK